MKYTLRKKLHEIYITHILSIHFLASHISSKPLDAFSGLAKTQDLRRTRYEYCSIGLLYNTS